MRGENVHLSDQDLLLAADGELSQQRQQVIRQHLRSCWDCRQRMAELEKTMADAVDSYHSLFNLQTLVETQERGTAAAESQLRVRLKAASQQRFAYSRSMALAACAAIIAVVVGLFIAERRTHYVAAQQVVSQLEIEVPNPRLTPGESVAVSARDVCQVQISRETQRVPEALREAVFSEYGLKDAPRNAYEVDFLITPELGGSATIRNLWPQPYASTSWNAHVKDALEERLHTLVCNGEMDLPTAQHEIATNWVNAYKKYVTAESPM
jgi:hypothetical protein